jgi:hypothetical protein
VEPEANEAPDGSSAVNENPTVAAGVAEEEEEEEEELAARGVDCTNDPNGAGVPPVEEELACCGNPGNPLNVVALALELGTKQV